MVRKFELSLCKLGSSVPAGFIMSSMTDYKLDRSINVHLCAIDEYDVSAFEDRECLLRFKRQRQCTPGRLLANVRDGKYRIVRSMEDGQGVRLHGKMAKEQIEQLTKLLGSADFRALSGDHGGLIRQDAETFFRPAKLTDRCRSDSRFHAFLNA